MLDIGERKIDIDIGSVEQASMKDWHYYRDPLRVYSPELVRYLI